MKQEFIVISIFLLCFATSSIESQICDDIDVDVPPLVCKNNKKDCFQGKYMPGFQTDFYEAFLGIPFAKSPVGKLRFANPEPVDNVWQGIYYADKEKDLCIQKNIIIPNPKMEGSEDCLYLNIYRPKNAERRLKPYPVMIYIHGGGFFGGSAGPSFHGGQYFMDNKKVILILIPYRLQVFGFLSTGDKSMPGNFALKDQLMALKWINKNVEYFNGDPNLITIFGQSAGASSAHFHMLSKLSRGLFHRVALMSGSAIASFNGPETDPLKLTRALAKALNISNSNTLSTEDLTKELRKIDASTLLETTTIFNKFDVDPVIPFRPVIEDKNVPDSFITELPLDIMKKGDFKYVPLMVTLVRDEGGVRMPTIYNNRTLLNQLNKNIYYAMTHILMVHDQPTKKVNELLDNIVRTYLKGKTIVDEENKQQFYETFGDLFFNKPLIQTVKLYTQLVPSNISANIIKFSFKGRHTYSRHYVNDPNADFGVVHCDDLIYLFNQPLLFTPFERNSVEAKVIEMYVDTFVHFAITGEPMKWVPIDNCVFNSDSPNKICDYQHIFRDNDTYRVHKDSTFDNNKLSCWDNI